MYYVAVLLLNMFTNFVLPTGDLCTNYCVLVLLALAINTVKQMAGMEANIHPL